MSGLLENRSLLYGASVLCLVCTIAAAFNVPQTASNLWSSLWCSLSSEKEACTSRVSTVTGAASSLLALSIVVWVIRTMLGR